MTEYGSTTGNEDTNRAPNSLNQKIKTHQDSPDMADHPA